MAFLRPRLASALTASDRWLMRHSASALRLSLGRWTRLGVALLIFAMVGILSPLVLLPEQLFTGASGTPNLLGQYVIKDLVLAAATLVLLATVRGRLVAEPVERERSAREKSDIVLAGLREDRSVAAV